MNLELFQDDELDIIIDTDNREVFASIRTLETVIGASREEIIDFIDETNMKLFQAHIKTSDGDGMVDFLAGNQIIMMMNRYNPVLLSKLRAIGGIRVHFHYLAGVEFD